MRELFVARRSLRDRQGCLRELQYYVLIDDIRSGGRFLYESYGIRVALSGTALHPACEESVHNITLSTTAIDELLERLVGATVSPPGLHLALENWLKSA